MNILLLGAGLQGRAALYDLVRSPDVRSVLVADLDIERLKSTTPELHHEKVSCHVLDAADVARTVALIQRADAVIHLLPAQFRAQMARLAIENGAHFVDASYAAPEYRDLHARAVAGNLAILPEFGLDPGIDLVLTGQALGEFDEIRELYSYGAGIPEASAAGNPLKYKVSWSFAGVLNAYTRPARVVRDGRPADIHPSDLFAPGNVHEVSVEELGVLEAYPNGDAVKYVEMLGLSASVREAGRYSMRWPGHSDLWRKLIGLGLLGDEPVIVGGQPVVPRRFMHDLLLPQLQYADGERDIALIRVEVVGLKNGLQKRLVYEVLDYRDLASGLLAMQRTVGFTASIGAQMILRGEISKRGVLSPLWDVPAESLVRRLQERGIHVKRSTSQAAG